MPATLRLRPLAPILGASLAPTIHPSRIERAADDMVADAGQVFHAAAAHEHDRVLLQRVPLARDVSRDLDPVRQPHAGHLAQPPIASKGGHRTCAMASPRPIPYSTRAGRQPTPARVCRQTDCYSTMPERRPSRNFARLRALEIGPSATPPARPEAHPPASTAQKSSPPLLSLSPASRGRHRSE